jgi:hypothetical protein
MGWEIGSLLKWRFLALSPGLAAYTQQIVGLSVGGYPCAVDESSRPYPRPRAQ